MCVHVSISLSLYIYIYMLTYYYHYYRGLRLAVSAECRPDSLPIEADELIVPPSCKMFNQSVA